MEDSQTAADATAQAPLLEPSQTDVLLSSFSELSIYLMGGSFIAGSLFTVLMLLILDFMRRNKPSEDA